MSVAIVEIKDVHLECCAKLYVETFNSEPWYDSWDYHSAFARLKDISHTPGFMGLVLMANGLIVAAVLGNVEHFYTGPIYNLKEMFVKQEFRGQKLGTQLLDALNAQLNLKEIKSIWLFTTKGDLTEKYYLKNGYIEDDDMIMMAKNL